MGRSETRHYANVLPAQAEVRGDEPGGAGRPSSKCIGGIRPGHLFDLERPFRPDCRPSYVLLRCDRPSLGYHQLVKVPKRDRQLRCDEGSTDKPALGQRSRSRPHKGTHRSFHPSVHSIRQSCSNKGLRPRLGHSRVHPMLRLLLPHQQPPLRTRQLGRLLNPLRKAISTRVILLRHLPSQRLSRSGRPDRLQSPVSAARIIVVEDRVPGGHLWTPTAKAGTMDRAGESLSGNAPSRLISFAAVASRRRPLSRTSRLHHPSPACPTRAMVFLPLHRTQLTGRSALRRAMLSPRRHLCRA